MVLRDQIIAIIYRSLLFIFGLSALIIVGISDSMAGPLNAFRKYGNLLTLLSALIVLFEIIFNGISLSKGRKRMPSGVYPPIMFLLLSLEIGLAIAHPLYCFFGDLTYFSGGEANFYTLFITLLFPIFLLGDWLLFGEKGNLKARHLLDIPLLPILYYLFSYLNHLIRGDDIKYATVIFDEKTFIGNPSLPALFGENSGWNGVVISTFSILSIYIATGIIIFFLGKLLSSPNFYKES